MIMTSGALNRFFWRETAGKISHMYLILYLNENLIISCILLFVVTIRFTLAIYFFHDFLSAILQESGNVALANIIFHETIIPKTFLRTSKGSKK